ncbi:MAG: hypothetical protein FWH41_03135 [Treponema sp.]|nr:hypothetical protein [Treponema sp.]
MRSGCAALISFFFFYAVFCLLPGCNSVMDFSAPIAGKFNTADLPVKNFEIIGPVYAASTEIHTVGSFGVVKRVEGAKITHNDLVIEAARLNADDIINVRIDKKTNGKAGFLNWLTGWERVFSYSGSAIAIKYVDE